MSMFDVVKAISGPVSNAAGAVYDIWRDFRDFNYAKDVQQTVWDREDNAVQRRAADLQAAGMNPYMAAGSAAGAGSVVGHVGTSPRNIGSFLDASMALQQDKQAKIQTNILKNQKDISDEERNMAFWNSQSAYYDFLDREDTFFYNRGLYRVPPTSDNGSVSFGHNDFTRNKPNLPFYNILQYQIENQKNSADLLQKQNDYYTSDRIMNYVGSLVPFLNMGNHYLNRR